MDIIDVLRISFFQNLIKVKEILAFYLIQDPYKKDVLGNIDLLMIEFDELLAQIDAKYRETEHFFKYMEDILEFYNRDIFEPFYIFVASLKFTKKPPASLHSKIMLYVG